MGTHQTIVAAVASYLVGAIPVGFLVVKAMTGQDIRSVGSGSIGATNVARVLGKRWFFITYFIDLLKGLTPCLVVGTIVDQAWPGPASFPVVLCGMMAVVGHNWPIYLRFRGGKGVATSCGVCVYVFPLPFLAGLTLFAVVLAIWRYVSLASIVASVSLCGFMWWLYRDRLGEARYTVGFATLAVVLILVRHRANIRRLLSGTEHKIGQRVGVPGGTETPAPPDARKEST